jgi:hypothetical protein
VWERETPCTSSSASRLDTLSFPTSAGVIHKQRIHSIHVTSQYPTWLVLGLLHRAALATSTSSAIISFRVPYLPTYHVPPWHRARADIQACCGSPLECLAAAYRLTRHYVTTRMLMRGWHSLFARQLATPLTKPVAPRLSMNRGMQCSPLSEQR